MQLWRRIENEQGQTRLQEVKDVSEIAADKPILFVFPGVGGTNGSNSQDEDKEGGFSRILAKGNPKAGGLCSYAAKVLDTETYLANLEARKTDPDAALKPLAEDYEILAVTYSMPVTPLKAKNSNENKQDRDPESHRFVRDFLRPLQDRENGQPITFFGISYGSIFAQNARRSLRRSYKRDHLSKEEIHEKVKSIYQITAADVSLSSISRGHSQTGDLQFSGLAFSFRRDLIGRAVNSTFRERVSRLPRAGENKEYVFTGKDNFYRIFTPAPKSVDMWLGEEGQQVHDAKLMNLFRTRHTTALILLDEGENGQMFRNAFRTIVNRPTQEQSQGVAVKDLLNAPLQSAIEQEEARQATEKGRPGFLQRILSGRDREQDNSPDRENRRGYGR